jgi:hypothetical protein
MTKTMAGLCVRTKRPMPFTYLKAQESDSGIYTYYKSYGGPSQKVPNNDIMMQIDYNHCYGQHSGPQFG